MHLTRLCENSTKKHFYDRGCPNQHKNSALFCYIFVDLDMFFLLVHIHNVHRTTHCQARWAVVLYISKSDGVQSPQSDMDILGS